MKQIYLITVILILFPLISCSTKNNKTGDGMNLDRKEIQLYVVNTMKNKYPTTIFVKPDSLIKIINDGYNQVPYLINELKNEKKWIRVAAAIALEKITKESFGEFSDLYNASKSDDKDIIGIYDSWISW